MNGTRIAMMAATSAAVAIVYASPAHASAAVSAPHVVGSGPIAWSHVGVRAQPRPSARVIVSLAQFRSDFRPRVVLALAERLDPRTGKPTWYRVAIPGRPNGRSGWVPAASVDVEPVDRWLVIRRGARTFGFYIDGKLVRSGRVAVGAPGMETPLGLFYVQWKFVPTWSVLGAYAFETSGYSKLSEWPGGGVVGVHGTNTPQLLGRAVSHGCVRLANADIEYLRSLVRVGTPVEIVA